MAADDAAVRDAGYFEVACEAGWCKALASNALPSDTAGMTSYHSARQVLRQATAADHDAVDRLFGGYDLSDPNDYADFLIAQAAAFLPVEDAIDRSEPSLVVPDWAERRRSALLQADLATLDRDIPGAPPLVAFTTREATLGAVYVLEGSRLGGQMLARTVYPGAPKSFLSANSSSHWRSLLSTLEKELVTDKQRATAVAAAREVFALFQKGARVFANAR